MINNPSNLYKGDAVVFNAMPYVQYAEKLRQQKAAKDEALDKYYQNLPNTINEKGLRDQDVEGLHERVGDMQKYWMENKNQIRKGTTPEAYNYGKMLRDIKGGVTTSLGDAGTSLKIGQKRLDPKNSYMFEGPEQESAILAHDLPVWDEGHKSIHLPTFSLPPAPFDQQKYGNNFTGSNGVKITPKVTYESIPGSPLQKMEVTSYDLSKDDLDRIHKIAATELHNNRSFKSFLKEGIDQDSAAAMKEKFEKYYGHEIKTDEDAATAYSLIGNIPNPQRKAVKNDEAVMSAKNKEWDRRNGITFGQSLEKIAANKSSGVNDSVGYLTDEYFANHGKVLPDKDVQTLKVTAPNVNVQGYVIASDIHPNDNTTITGRDASKKQQGVKPIKLSNGEDAYLVEEGTGDWIGVNGKIDREAVRRNVLEKRQNTKVKINQAGNKSAFGAHPLPKDKPRTVKQNGHTFVWDEKTGTYQ